MIVYIFMSIHSTDPTWGVYNTRCPWDFGSCMDLSN